MSDGYTFWELHNRQTCYSNQVGWGVVFGSAKWQKEMGRTIIRFTASDLADEIARLRKDTHSQGEWDIIMRERAELLAEKMRKDQRLSELVLENDHQRAQIHNLTLYLGAAMGDLLDGAPCRTCRYYALPVGARPCSECKYETGIKADIRWQWRRTDQFSGMPGYVARKEDKA